MQEVTLYFQFSAVLKRVPPPTLCYVVEVPAKISRAIGIKGIVAVAAHVHGLCEIITCLCPYGEGRHYLRLDAWVRKNAGLIIGKSVDLQIQVHKKQVRAAIPDDFRKELRNEDLIDVFDSFSVGKQNHEIRQIERCSNVRARERRIQKALETVHRQRERQLNRVRAENGLF